MSDKLKDAIAAHKQAAKRVAETMVAEYPVGAITYWARGKNVFYGTVLDHSVFSHHPRIKVRNELSQCEYWIHATDIV